VWQWLRHGARLADGRLIDLALVRSVLGEELPKLEAMVDDAGSTKHRFADAAAIFQRLIEAPRFPEWLTLPAYERLVVEGA
ncbi:MAG: malate synthase A, partial [Stellaceae bacterium]